LGALFMVAALVACSAPSRPAGGPAGTGQVGGSEVAGMKIPQGIPDHPYPLVIPADEKERDASKYKTGGEIRYFSLDPPHLDISLASSCTVYNVGEMVYNKLLRAKLGPEVNPFSIELEGDLAKSWDVSADG